MFHWFFHFSGINNPSGPWYAWWSGPGSDLQEIAIIAAVIAMFRRHNCHVKGCWRLQWKQHGEHMLCKKHHPTDPPTSDQI